ncbi:glutathione S-transferase family protein [Chelatococcus reniformis]|nr:glutathione S-transferase family protein [Chelatococcus reniformis]
MKLIIASKCYSSWSLRPWLLMKAFAVPFEEVVIPLRTAGTAQAIAAYSPSGRVPALIDGPTTVWDSLAVIEYLAERRADLSLWPRDSGARAVARSISAEMHSGFQALRQACPMNLAFRFAARDRGEAVAADTARVTAIWRQMRQSYGAKAGPDGGPFLFGGLSAADAMFAPVVTRLDTYSIPVDPVSGAYMDAVLALAPFKEWRAAALTEPAIAGYDDIGETPIEHFRSA